MIAVGYFRESGQEGRSDSVGRQNRRFVAFCEAQGFEVEATFGEEARTSSAAFARLMEHLKRPEKGFLVVVVPSPQTLSDDAVVAAARCLQIERLGARVAFMDVDADAEADPLLAIVEGWSAGKEDLRDKVKAALRRKAVRGEVLGRPPYGYRIGPRNRLEPVDDEAVVVRYIFSLYLDENLGIRLISRRLNEQGLRTRRNQPWSMVSIRDILRNRVYLGTYQRLGIRVPGSHAALVSPEQFRRVDERLHARRTNYSQRTVSGFLLSGLVACDACGNRMIGVSRRQTWRRQRDNSQQVASYRYYQCESRTNQGICSYNTQRAEDLEETVRQKLKELDPAQLATAGDDAAVLAQWQAEARRLKDRLLQIDRRLGRQIEAVATGELTPEKLRSAGLDLAEERMRVEEELHDAEWRAEHYASAAERRRTRSAALDVLVSQWETLSLQERRQLLKEIVDQIRAGGESGVTLILRP
jgi:DNA invertase Pin-like site-specific DNA recombinase